MPNSFAMNLPRFFRFITPNLPAIRLPDGKRDTNAVQLPIVGLHRFFLFCRMMHINEMAGRILLPDGSPGHAADENQEEGQKWCYAGGEFRYTSKEELIDFCAEHLANENWPAEQVRAHMEAVMPNLKHWK